MSDKIPARFKELFDKKLFAELNSSSILSNTELMTHLQANYDLPEKTFKTPEELASVLQPGVEFYYIGSYSTEPNFFHYVALGATITEFAKLPGLKYRTDNGNEFTIAWGDLQAHFHTVFLDRTTAEAYYNRLREIYAKDKLWQDYHYYAENKYHAALRQYE